LETSRLLLKETFDTHADGILRSHIFRKFFPVLIIELAYEALHDPIDIFTYLTLLQDEFALLVFQGYKNTLQYVQFVV
jgi:hypothetical protein